MDTSRMGRKTTLRELLKSRARYLNEMESAKHRAKWDATHPGKQLAKRTTANPPCHKVRH